MRRLGIALAVLVGGLTAIPGTAGAHDAEFVLGAASNGWVSVDEATYITTAVGNWTGFHGGVLRTRLHREAPWGDGTQDVELGVRFNDGSLGMSWTSAPCDGAGCHYTLSFRHPWP